MLTKYCEKSQDQWDRYHQQVIIGSLFCSSFNRKDTTSSSVLLRNNTPSAIPHTKTRKGYPILWTISGLHQSADKKLKNKLEQSHQVRRKSLNQTASFQKRRYDLKAKKTFFEKEVWIFNQSRKIGQCPKPILKWKGPHIVEKNIADVTYRVKRTGKQPSSVYHVDCLALYTGRNI